MVVTSMVADFMDTLADGLALREGLDGVGVMTGELSGANKPPREGILLAGVETMGQEWESIGDMDREERFSIGWSIWAIKPGSGESVIRATRRRAFALLAEVETHLRENPDLNFLIRVAEVKPTLMWQDAHDSGRVCQIEGVIDVTADLPTNE